MRMHDADPMAPLLAPAVLRPTGRPRRCKGHRHVQYCRLVVPDHHDEKKGEMCCRVIYLFHNG